MGVDCKYISQFVHFGGSRNIESYLQECGRAGRNSELSTCYLLHNGTLMKHCDEDMKNYVFSKSCRRKEISKSCRTKKSATEKVLKYRPVSRDQKEKLLLKLKSYMQSLLPEDINHCTPVSIPNIFYEFGTFQIKQVLKHGGKIFTLSDVNTYV